MQGTGIKLGTIFLAATSVVITLIICFASSWELSLVELLLFPLVFIAYSLSYRLYYTQRSGEFLQASTHLVIETISNIKTVVSHGAEEYFIKTVDHYLQSHAR